MPEPLQEAHVMEPEPFSRPPNPVTTFSQNGQGCSFFFTESFSFTCEKGEDEYQRKGFVLSKELRLHTSTSFNIAF
jgi:hypothetical protein